MISFRPRAVAAVIAFASALAGCGSDDYVCLQPLALTEWCAKGNACELDGAPMTDAAAWRFEPGDTLRISLADHGDELGSRDDFEIDFQQPGIAAQVEVLLDGVLDSTCQRTEYWIRCPDVGHGVQVLELRFDKLDASVNVAYVVMQDLECTQAHPGASE